jgi:NAD(P)-dependent dehydrogenase (short-subunit alcohol dehydrogenase family)
MSERLPGAVAVVTGGGAGIGEATCLRLAEEGAHVVAVDWHGDDARDTVETIEAAGGPEAVAVEADVSDEAAVATMAERVDERFGRADVLVNNAGLRVEPHPVTEADAASWDRVLGVNLLGTAFCSKHVIPLMTGGETPPEGGETGDGGRIVNVASVGANWARPNWAQYDATKGAIVAMTRDMACDHAADGIRVNAVSPGWAITDYHVGDRTGEEADRFVAEKTSWGGDDEAILRRAAKPREIADAILFLASEESSFVTGIELPVDGGRSVV